MTHFRKQRHCSFVPLETRVPCTSHNPLYLVFVPLLVHFSPEIFTFGFHLFFPTKLEGYLLRFILHIYEEEDTVFHVKEREIHT